MKHKPTIKLFVILAAVALISCKGSKDVQKPLVEKPENSFLKLETNFLEGKENVQQLWIRNISKDTLILIKPADIRIEKRGKNQWNQVRILQCPCGSDCLPGPPRMLLAPGQEHKLSWDLYLSYCVNDPGKKLPREVRELAKGGTYRWDVSYMRNQDKKVEQTAVFTLP